MATLMVSESAVILTLENHGSKPVLVGNSIEAFWTVEGGDQLSSAEMESGHWGELFRSGLEVLPPLSAATTRSRGRDVGDQTIYSIPRQAFKGGELAGTVDIRIIVPAAVTVSKPLVHFDLKLTWPLHTGDRASGYITLPTD